MENGKRATLFDVQIFPSLRSYHDTKWFHVLVLEVAGCINCPCHQIILMILEIKLSEIGKSAIFHLKNQKEKSRKSLLGFGNTYLDSALYNECAYKTFSEYCTRDSIGVVTLTHRNFSRKGFICSLFVQC